MHSDQDATLARLKTRMKPILPQRYDFSEDDVSWVLGRIREILEARAFLTLGPYVKEFEQCFAGHLTIPHAVAVSSGTAALEIIFRALDVRGHEVIVPTNTFAATAFAVIHAGGTPVFADCCADLTADPEDVERRITLKTKAVVAVHIGGLVSPGAVELRELCERKGIHFVEDAAHAHGSGIDNHPAGTLGVAAAFSFFSTKVMTTGEGGMIVTADRAIADRARLLRDQAKVDGGNYHQVLGYNWRMTELQAVLGLVQLRRLRQFVDRRAEIARLYEGGWAGAPGIGLLKISSRCRPNYYKYVLFLKEKAPWEVGQQLKDRYGVRLGGNVYDIPCHQQPVFREFAREPLPKAEDLCRRHICPPIYPSLSDEEARYVVEAVREVVR